MAAPAGTELTLRADAVCIAVGLSPNTKLAQMCGCRMVWDPSKGGFYPAGDDSLETSRAGVYAAGDLTGIEEASIALDEGRLAGINAAFSLGYETPEAREKLPLCRKRLGGLRAGLMETEEPSKSGMSMSVKSPVILLRRVSLDENWLYWSAARKFRATLVLRSVHSAPL